MQIPLREYEKKYNDEANRKYKQAYAHPASVIGSARILPCNSLAPIAGELDNSTEHIIKGFDASAKAKQEEIANNE